ncbi:MAG TPA: cytochrome ubiquinol oxidase subunit I [Acidocella sp.]|jgi:cytochrome d ubiquinol oxidase subunit I|nr:cytochrome ubiquinol oxidase subunit I [Acidocella sp.]
MQNSALSLLLSRLDFAWITSMHIIYPPLTAGLSILLFIAEWRWVRTDDEQWYRLTRFFEKLFIINFGAGVATGITMEMAFGILYGPFSQAAGPFFGQVLAYETISAFMYEAGFIGLMVFGWGKLGKKMHLFATANVAVASTLSVWWILVANSWMQTPRGVVFKNGFFHVVNWGAALINPDVTFAVPHMEVAAIELSLCFVTAVSAWQLLKKRHVPMFQRALKWSVLTLVVIAPLQVYLGDGLGGTVAHDQASALAALEGHYHTYNPNGSVDTSWEVVGWPNAKGDDMALAIAIPHVLSLLETHTWNGKVTGLDDIPPQDRPPVLIPFYAFRIMAGIGTVFMLLAFWGLFLAVRGKMAVQNIIDNKWFLRAAVVCGVLPYIAVWTGWWTREISRQPWVVYGMMTTAQGTSRMSVAQEIFWLVGYIGFEILVWGGTWYFFAKVVRHGPDMESPTVDGPMPALDPPEPHAVLAFVKRTKT